MSLETLVSKIKAEHRQVLQTARKSLTHARNAGELLAQAKEEVAKERLFRWSKWVEQECGILERTASNYIRVYRNWAEIEQAGDLSTLTMRAALALLKKRSRQSNQQRELLTLADLGGMMSKFGISGKPDRLLALLKELGVSVTVNQGAAVATAG